MDYSSKLDDYSKLDPNLQNLLSDFEKEENVPEAELLPNSISSRHSQGASSKMTFALSSTTEDQPDQVSRNQNEINALAELCLGSSQDATTRTQPQPSAAS